MRICWHLQGHQLLALWYAVLATATAAANEPGQDKNLREVLCLKVHAGSAVAFSPDSRYVLSGSGEKTALLWDAATGKEIRRFDGSYTRGVESVAFSPDGHHVLSIGLGEGVVRIHEVASGKQVRQFRAHSSHAWIAAFSPDGKLILTVGGDACGFLKKDVTCQVKLWDRQTGREVRRFKGHESFVAGAAFSSDGRYLVTGAGHLGPNGPVDCTVRLWEVATGREIRRFEGHTYTISSVAFSFDGRHVLSGSWDKTIRLWEVETGKEMQRFSHEKNVWCMAVSPDGKYVLSGSGQSKEPGELSSKTEHADCTVRLWELRTGKEVCRFTGHTQPVMGVAFSPDGSRALSSSDDGTVRLYRLR